VERNLRSAAEIERNLVYSFEYVKPRSLSEAGELIKNNPDARPLAGGMTLLPTLKARLAQPSHLIDISGLEELRGIEVKDGTLSIGAATRHREVETSAAVGKSIPALAYLASRIGDPQVRNCGTMGGSVANNDPAADYPAAVLALNGTVVTTSREIAADDFFQGIFTTALEPDEIVVRIVLKVPKRAVYQKFAHPVSGYAMAGVFVAQTDSGVRVAVTGAGPGVFRWSEAEAALGKKMTPDAVANLRVAADTMNEDIHGSREYRANLVAVMLKRAVTKLAEGMK
jgi:carbon-monoxide dehydrogenase medium subunit